MNKNLLLYGVLGFLVVRYLMKKRQNAAPIDSKQLPDIPDYDVVRKPRIGPDSVGPGGAEPQPL